MVCGEVTSLNADNLQNRFILHFVTEMEREMNESLQFQDDFYKPQTIAAKLNAVAKFIRFTRQRNIFFWTDIRRNHSLFKFDRNSLQRFVYWYSVGNI